MELTHQLTLSNNMLCKTSITLYKACLHLSSYSTPYHSNRVPEEQECSSVMMNQSAYTRLICINLHKIWQEKPIYPNSRAHRPSSFLIPIQELTGPAHFFSTTHYFSVNAQNRYNRLLLKFKLRALYLFRCVFKWIFHASKICLRVPYSKSRPFLNKKELKSIKPLRQNPLPSHPIQKAFPPSSNNPGVQHYCGNVNTLMIF